MELVIRHNLLMSFLNDGWHNENEFRQPNSIGLIEQNPLIKQIIDQNTHKHKYLMRIVRSIED